MALNFKVYEGNQSKTLGKVGEVCDTYSLLSAKNFMSDNRVVIKLMKADGTSETVLCSPAVSEGLRNKTIKMSQLQGFDIRETVTTDGAVTNTIFMPTAEVSEMPAVKVGTAFEEYQPVSKFNVEDLVAL